MADRTSLSRATESSDAPTPGYLYLDIARGAASSPAACQETAQYLIRRLQNKSNHNIKFKCLKVIQKTAENNLTRGQFKREICQNPSAITSIKDALQFRGPPDPIRGDAIYEKVRVAAKECLDAVYSESPSSEMAIGSSHNAGLAGGISSNYGQQNNFGGPPQGGAVGHNAAAGGGIGGRKMEGIGNPMFKDPRLQEKNSVSKMTIGQVASAVGSTVVGMIKDPLAKNASPRHSMPSVTVNYGNSNRIGNLPGYGGNSGNGYGGGGYGGNSGGGYGGNSGSGYAGNNSGSGYGGSGIFSSAPPGAQQLAQSTGGAWTMASNRGPNAIGGGGSAAHAPSGVGGSWAVQSQPAGHTSVAAQARAESHGSINSAVPVSSTPYQNSGAAASDGTYERNLIEELCPPGGMRPEPPEDKLANFAQSVPSLNADLVCPVLLDALEDGQPWIIKAKTLCVIETTINSAAESMGSSNPYSDFFHTCASEIEPLASHARPAVRDPAKRVLKALGIAIASSHTKPTRIPNEPKAPVPEPPAPPPEPVNLLDFGDEDEFGSSSAPQLPPVPLSEPPPPPSVAPPPETTKKTEENSLFGGLQINGNKTTVTTKPPKPKPSPAPAENIGSAFGFIGATATETTAAPTTPAKPTPTAEEELLMLSPPSQPAPTSSNPPMFDPLLSLGNGTSQPQAPKLTNAQIEAMSYQQNMIMMQQQMQQMQMAMVMQQQQQQGGHANMAMNKQPSFKNVMQSNTMAPSYIPDMKMMKPIGNTNRNDQFSILENAKKEEQQKSFDFIKDAMKGAK